MDKLQAVDDNPENSISLMSSLSISELISNSGTTFEVNFEDLDKGEEQLSYKPDEVYKYTNPECCDLYDEDTYQEGEPFEKLMAKMENVIPDGGVKKRILRKGYGDILPEKALVTIHYNAYIEYNDDPFDSTYVRKKAFTFRIGDEAILPGLDIAVRTMKVYELSQFLIEPKYSYGVLGCLNRVPPNSTILFEIEVQNSVDSGAAIIYQNLSEDKKQEFGEIYKYAHALCSKANSLYGKQLYKQAIRDYNMAVTKLERCTLANYTDQEKQQPLLLRLFTNLVVSYTKIKEPRRTCINCNKIYNMCKGTSLKVPTKVYFNHARSLILLSDFKGAERKLKQAQRLEPQNKDITIEFIKLDAKKKESYDREVALAKAIFKNTEINKELHDENEVTKEFCQSMEQFCQDLKNDSQSTQYNLPEKLTKKELEFCEKQVQKYGLILKSSKQDGVEKHFIAKSSISE